MKYNHYWGNPIPGCRHYIVEVKFIDEENQIQKGTARTSVMACSKQHAMCLIQQEFQDSIKVIQAWLDNDAYPIEKPDPFGRKNRNTPLKDAPF